jgi:hypothetical protein
VKDVSPAATYATLLPELVKAARELGYALAPHGSFSRDFDLIAVPWTEDAASAEALVLRILSASGGQFRDSSKPAGTDEHGKTRYELVRGDQAIEKPHGRRGWVIWLGHNSPWYIDLSVMPRAECAP